MKRRMPKNPENCCIRGYESPQIFLKKKNNLQLSKLLLRKMFSSKRIKIRKRTLLKIHELFMQVCHFFRDAQGLKIVGVFSECLVNKCVSVTKTF